MNKKDIERMQQNNPLMRLFSAETIESANGGAQEEREEVESPRAESKPRARSWVTEAKTVKKTLLLKPSTNEKLELSARARGISPNELVNRLIDNLEN